MILYVCINVKYAINNNDNNSKITLMQKTCSTRSAL